MCTFQLQEFWMFCSYFTWEITTPATRFPHVSQNQSPPGLYHQRCVTLSPQAASWMKNFLNWRPKKSIFRGRLLLVSGKGVVSPQFSETFCQKILNMIRSMSTDSLSLHHHLQWGLGTLVSNGLCAQNLEDIPRSLTTHPWWLEQDDPATFQPSNFSGAKRTRNFGRYSHSFLNLWATT